MPTQFEHDYHIQKRDDTVHTAWNNGLDPVLQVESGDIVRFDCWDANGDAITPETTADDLRSTQFDGHHLTGPVAVDGARPGDVLQVEILAAEHHGWGYTMFRPGEQGSGLLPEEFPDPAIHHWDLEGDVGRFVDGIELPLAPFPGNLGVAPAEPGEHSTTPPRAVGGNLDVKHLVAGSTLHLPVAVEDALFSIGDGHGAQGDGEVCVTAIEAPMSFTVRLSVRSDLDVDRPRFETPAMTPGVEGPALGTTGVADDLTIATKDATRSMIARLHGEHGLSRAEAYLLCSVAMDLRISEVVNEPNYVVSGLLSKTLLEE